jgi:hypothetical protein
MCGEIVAESWLPEGDNRDSYSTKYLTRPKVDRVDPSTIRLKLRILLRKWIAIHCVGRHLDWSHPQMPGKPIASSREVSMQRVVQSLLAAAILLGTARLRTLKAS